MEVDTIGGHLHRYAADSGELVEKALRRADLLEKTIKAGLDANMLAKVALMPESVEKQQQRELLQHELEKVYKFEFDREQEQRVKRI